jgi:hypothetical protein
VETTSIRFPVKIRNIIGSDFYRHCHSLPPSPISLYSRQFCIFFFPFQGQSLAFVLCHRGNTVVVKGLSVLTNE